MSYKAVTMGRRNWKGGEQYAIESGNTFWIAQHLSERMAKRIARLLNEDDARRAARKMDVEALKETP